MNWPSIEPFFKPDGFHTGAIHEVKWLIEHLEPGGRLLDIGCLDGRFAELVSPFCHTYGIDIREAALPLPYHFVKGNILKHVFPVWHFDQIVSLSTIEHIGLHCYGNKGMVKSGDRAAVEACFHLLAPSGKLLITAPYDKAAHGHYHGNKMWERRYNYKAAMALFDHEQYEVLEYTEDRAKELVLLQLKKRWNE